VKRTIAAVAAFAFTTLIGAPAFAQPGVEGLWAQADNDGVVNAWFLFEKKDDVYVGRLVKAFLKPGDPKIDVCDKCPAERKGARMMGLTIVSDMKRDGLHYDEGQILDPRDGSMYHAIMDLSEDGKALSVRGYLLIEALGQTQVWHRLPDDALKTADIPKELFAGQQDTKVEADASKVVKSKPKAPKHAAKVSADSKTTASN
jgi:uncharacterized protein (DUF2147 family)